jgi:hypothetical protein
MVELNGKELRDAKGDTLTIGNYYSIRPVTFAGTVSFENGAAYISNPDYGIHLITHLGQGEIIGAESLHRIRENGDPDADLLYRGLVGAATGE